MVFSSPVFLFGFLPLALFVYYISPTSIKNIVLLLFSLLFYAWGETFYLLVLLISITVNYGVGIFLFKCHESTRYRKGLLFIGVVINVSLLLSFKYGNFIVDNVNIVFSQIGIQPIILAPIHLPLGISFFTFQGISYIVDVYKTKESCQKNIFGLALYIALFPQLIAGPIVRYNDISRQIVKRQHSFEMFADGVQRFVYGLAKKTLIANPLGEVADSVFILSGNELTMPLAWIGILSYTLQIYFDFSGYSDMAIGLGRMYGFHFLENFNYPYISTSVREFWRRWHISLSTWFRDYVYIPLGGSRVSTARVYTNLFLVFVLTGLWHGASWNFLFWGLFHGLFLASEHAGFSIILNRLWRPLQHLYLLLVVIVGWVFFRAENLSSSVSYLVSMFNINNVHTTLFQFAQVLSHEALYAFVIGVVLIAPVYPFIEKFVVEKVGQSCSLVTFAGLSRIVLLSFVMFLSIIKIAASTFNPFIYFRF